MDLQTPELTPPIKDSVSSSSDSGGGPALEAENFLLEGKKQKSLSVSSDQQSRALACGPGTCTQQAFLQAWELVRRNLEGYPGMPDPRGQTVRNQSKAAWTWGNAQLAGECQPALAPRRKEDVAGSDPRPYTSLGLWAKATGHFDSGTCLLPIFLWFGKGRITQKWQHWEYPSKSLLSFLSSLLKSQHSYKNCLSHRSSQNSSTELIWKFCQNKLFLICQHLWIFPCSKKKWGCRKEKKWRGGEQRRQSFSCSSNLRKYLHHRMLYLSQQRCAPHVYSILILSLHYTDILSINITIL